MLVDLTCIKIIEDNINVKQQMATIKLNNKQLRLIQTALDFYSRVGILQFDEILSHPTIDKALYDQFTPKNELKVGDHTMRGEIVEISKGHIKTKGSWGNDEEVKTWTDVKNIKLSPDWCGFHYAKDKIKDIFNIVKKEITGKDFGHGSYGIHSTEVDDSCRQAFDIIQVIRHEFWKENPKRSSITVDSSISLTTSQTPVKVELDTISEIRKDKLEKIKKSE